MTTQHIRNFSIIAHIDHGKSTLADRLLELTHTLSPQQMRAQVLDSMDLERERGITIKAHAIRMEYTAPDERHYVLNLIDTPGHVDFSYEVSRSLAACEGALLVVDAVQGIEAQTISNLFLALENDLTIIPLINKIDLPNAQTDVVVRQIVELLGVSEDEILKISAKAGIGVDGVLQAVIDRIPPPPMSDDAPLRALIFDSIYDQYRGAVPYVRVVDGVIKPGMSIKMCSNGKIFEVQEVGILRLNKSIVPELTEGEVGYVVGNIRNVAEASVGDTITDAARPCAAPLPGYREAKPMVFSGLYPTSSEDYEGLKEALEKYRLNDAALVYEPETSIALGFGFRCGFLGLLHMEIVQERLEREYGLSILATLPSVEYRVTTTAGATFMVDNPADMPDASVITTMEEPYVRAQMVVPSEFIGNLMKLAKDRRGVYKSMEYLDSTRVALHYELPLAEIVFDFYDRLKSTSRGYASFDYEFFDYRPSELVRLNILLNGEMVDALSMIIHREKAYEWGRELCQRLRKIIPRQLFEIAIQAAIGGKIIARETISPLRKNVTAKCYGGDITRKRKLLEKQREGKRRMKQVGNVEVPQEAFLAVLNIREEEMTPG
ncbi:MAG: elongation factor 4 [candidate division Zixibacteria bacterium]|nr:elongation factor 4 [candidate division Zixibacteria bacterium]